MIIFLPSLLRRRGDNFTKLAIPTSHLQTPDVVGSGLLHKYKSYINSVKMLYKSVRILLRVFNIEENI